MRAVEFTSEISDQGELRVPKDVVQNLPSSGKVRVIVLFSSDETNDAAWSSTAAQQFLAGYAPGDAIYDEE